ncbi:hypothetical protein BJD55_gp134 [Gordonia phage Yvonnetastic]|uniref:Uncharacterized protein n=1 Tax=Gordonia phage Yvonnetastic TaxID=1821566 RepID=A0A142K949_9CAUD|nr:hypothetical protein BJD55_gp134 [Gordonia phage Yvonnetastic]AMS02632.1 hypothetical protein SEA_YVONNETASTIC_88 [Gordonia phage Yvonnetastic]WKW86064.1 hypothetical protein SEA_JONJAMES_90 [Gordonia Phage JonJames]
MSADNWTTCENCFEEAEQAHQRFLQNEDKRLRELYGKVAPEEYLRAVADSKQTELESQAVVADAAVDNTFREDYEFYGASEGYVHISYCGRCTVCGYGLEFNDTRDLEKPK